jgi:hypothetical protein
MPRPTATSRDVRAGCLTCHGGDARWHGPQAQGQAALHHDRTQHPTWCNVTMTVRYGQAQADPRQIDIEDSIAAFSSSGGEPDAAPLPDPDAPVPVSTGVSAPKAAQSRQALAAKPEPTHV